MGKPNQSPDRNTMSPSANAIIAKKARTKAEADFATWLMMAKLGGFDDLPSNAGHVDPPRSSRTRVTIGIRGCCACAFHLIHFRSTPESGRRGRHLGRPLRANKRHCMPRRRLAYYRSDIQTGICPNAASDKQRTRWSRQRKLNLNT
jgi:hypothetical protein